MDDPLRLVRVSLHSGRSTNRAYRAPRAASHFRCARQRAVGFLALDFPFQSHSATPPLSPISAARSFGVLPSNPMISIRLDFPELFGPIRMFRFPSSIFGQSFPKRADSEFEDCGGLSPQALSYLVDTKAKYLVRRGGLGHTRTIRQHRPRGMVLKVRIG